MSYNYIEDVKGIKDLKEIGITASLVTSALGCIVIRVTDDGESMYVQENSTIKGEIVLVDIEYFQSEPEILEMLNIDEYDFEEYYGWNAPGFRLNGKIYLQEDFTRDDY